MDIAEVQTVVWNRVKVERQAEPEELLHMRCSWSPKVKHIPRKTLGMRREGEKLGAGRAQEEAGRRREKGD